MGRKRKRANAPAASIPATAPPAGAADPTSSTPQHVTLGADDTPAKHGAEAGDAAEQLPEDDEDSDGMPGIPWALPPPQAGDQTDEDDEEQQQQQQQEEEEEEEEERGGEEGGEENGNSDAADGDGFIPLSATISDPENRWKQHPDRRRKISGRAARGSGRGRSRSNGKSGGKSGGRANRKEPGGGGRGGARGRRGVENAGAGADSDEATEDGPGAADGYYGPPPPPCTVFAPRKGKIHRVHAGSPSAASAPTALVVGLDPLEQLCFVGAALVRCGRGQADLSGYTLLPAAWGPYVEAHSPRWMGLLVVRALGAEEYSEDEVARGGGTSSLGDGAGAVADDDAAETEIEEAIDLIADDFPVVVVLKSLSGSRPLEFLSAQADADALYSQAVGAGDLRVAVDHQALHRVPEARGGKGELNEDDATAAGEVAASLPLRLMADLRLPGMQVVITPGAGLGPLTVSQGWAEAANAVLAAPPPTTGGGGGGGGAVLVCGAKGVGKSTLCRFLVNRMLSRHREVAYMDCDLGQPEFTAPGQVSLHLLQTPVVGPPHANIRRPQLAYFVGTTTSKPEPLLYSAAVRALAEHAGVTAGTGQQQQQQQQQEEEPLSASFFAGAAPPPAPLVVNTDGWVKGMGEDLLGAVIDAVRPRHIVQILGTSAAKTFEVDLTRLPEGCEVHRVEAWSPPPASVGGPPRPSAQDQRTLRLVAYFLGQGGCGSGGIAAEESPCSTTATEEGCERLDAGAVASRLLGSASGGRDNEGGHGGGGGGGDQLRGASMRGGKVYDLEHEVAALLAAARPRRVPWRAVQIRVMNGSVSPSVVLHAVNGALVGLVVMPRQSCDGGGGGGGVEAPVGEGLVCLAETPLAPCVGLGIVRSVDVEKRVLYVLTPEPSDVLKDVNVLVVGSLQLPMVMLYDPNWCSHPYLSSEAVGGGVIKNRTNLLRK